MFSFDCDVGRHAACDGERRTGTLSSPLVIVSQCSCACHGPDRDGHELRREWESESEPVPAGVVKAVRRA